MRRPHFTVVSVTFLLLFSSGDHVGGQDAAIIRDRVHTPWRVRWDIYDPYDAVTSRVHAQAELIRAQGDAVVDLAIARRIRADAYSAELDNWMKELEVRWDRKITAQKKEIELNHLKQIARLEYLNDRKWKNSRTWDRLKNHPELSDSSIDSGAALNFLLDRLGASALPYEFDSATSRFGSEAIEQLRLERSLLEHIQLKQGSFVFAASQNIEEQSLFWPYLLRREEFDAERNAYEAARRNVVSESRSTSEVSVATIEQLRTSLSAFREKFRESSAVKEWIHKNHRYAQFRSSGRFLWDLDREIAQIEDAGDLSPFQGQGGYDPYQHGDHVISLLCFMNRNGLEFAKPQPGGEFAYHNLFVQMRAVYLTVADGDESIRPKDLRTLTE